VALPSELRESLTAMRKVIADQIEALNELSDVAARHAASQEIVRPLAEAPSVRRPAEAPREARPAPAPASDERGGWISTLLNRASSTPPPRPAETPPEPAVAAPAPALAPVPAAAMPPESLNALSGEIARAIDAK